jgi:invasion protein IalB
MTACARVLLAFALALILLPTVHAQTRKTVGPWGVVCSGGATGYCSASNRIKSVSGPYRFQLNVSRERPGAALELALLTGYQHPRDGSPITVQVDAGKPLRLETGTGYRRAGRSNTFVVAAEETERLVQQMRTGQRVRFRFEDAKGAAVDAAFSLSGLSGAMAFMDKMQPAPRVRAPAASAQAAAEQPAPADLKPAPAPATSPPERAPARGTTPAPVEKPAVPASPVAAAPAERQVTPAPVPAPAATPSPREAAPTPAVAPTPAKEAAPAPPTPVAPPARTTASTTPATAAPATGQSGRATAAAPAPAAPAKPVPASPPAAEVAAVPAQKPAAQASGKPARAQQQAAVNTAPSASRKRGAKSIRQFSCIGNGPLWTLVIDGDSARYAALTDAGQRDTIELAGKLNVTGDGPTPVIDWRGKSDWGGSFRAQVSEEACRDGTSDFEYKVQVSLPGRKTVRGCCNAGLPPAPVVAAAPTDTTQFPVADLRNRPETDWSRYLFDLLPAIQACIDKTPEPEPYATKAWPMSQGMVGVRTRNSQGGWFECVADANGRSVERFVPLPSGAPPAPNEDRVVFSPPDHPPVGGSCYKHERVLDGLGDFMGWLSTNGCS